MEQMNSFYVYISNVDSMQMDMFIYHEYDEANSVTLTYTNYVRIFDDKQKNLQAIEDLRQSDPPEKMTKDEFTKRYLEVIEECKKDTCYGKFFATKEELIKYIENLFSRKPKPSLNKWVRNESTGKLEHFARKSGQDEWCPVV
jgi:hypothetical protein